MKIKAENLDHKAINEKIKECGDRVEITDCLGQRFIGAGSCEKYISVSGIPGNALGAYLNGTVIEVFANAQDAVGDTMNAGEIIIHGNIGDAAGYAMRGGKIFVEGNAGYRAGIHMKEYGEKKPVITIGGVAGSFLGEYQAGGIIIVLGLEESQKNITGNFPCAGMHGGKIFLRSDCKDIVFPKNTNVKKAQKEDLDEIAPVIEEFCKYFGKDKEEILNSYFTLITPDSNNPYKQMYVPN